MARDDNVLAVLQASLDLLEDVRALVQRGMSSNPTDLDRRKLEQIHTQLAAASAALHDRIDSFQRKPGAVGRWPDNVRAHLASLAGEIAMAQQQSQVAGSAVTLAARAIALALSVAEYEPDGGDDPGPHIIK